MNDLIKNVTHIFEKQFGYKPDTFIQAPGRVNLIGEHTDYNDGFVLPCAIDYQTIIACHKRNDNLINVIAADYDNEQDQFSLNEMIEKHKHYQWANYIRGVIKYLQYHNSDLHGVDFVVSGNVPQGAGLSSSASLEVAVGKMMQVLYNLPSSGTELALIGQEAENKFVGCNCGIMDQLISALGKELYALLIDCRTLEAKPVPLPKDCAIVIINSNVQRGLVGSEYNMRREQCEKAAKALGVNALRDANLEQLNKIKNELSLDVYKRAHHVITENERTLEAANALINSDYEKLSSLMAESHLSMRDDFEITIPAIDYLVEIVFEVIGNKGGVRMTGGGFGGCIVAIMPHDKIKAVKKAVSEKYHARFGLKEDIYVCNASAGASNVTN